MATSEGSSSPPPPPPPPPPPGSRHTLGSPRNSPRMTRKHQQVSASLATTPTQSILSPEFVVEGFPSSGSRPSGLDRVLLERNLERLLQERGSHPDENRSELGRYVLLHHKVPESHICDLTGILAIPFPLSVLFQVKYGRYTQYAGIARNRAETYGLAVRKL